MLVTGEIENVPLLDVIQVVSFSRQTGLLVVEASAAQGTVLFQSGAIVGAESSSTRALLLRAATEEEPRTRRNLRRVQALAALTELLSLREGVFRFKRIDKPLESLGGCEIKSFYEAGPMETGEILLALATTIDKPDYPSTPAAARENERSHRRYGPTLVAAVIDLGDSKLEGHLTNLSAGGAFFQADVLPPDRSTGRVRFELPGGLGEVEALARIAWVHPEGKTGRRGAGLTFLEMSDDARSRLADYLKRYQSLADRYREG